ncbi:MAG TPA: DUF885 family protein [Vicinamibacterales bacterium]|nr:DUF885 family protein [Vicinamibacterales bacterium]
MTRSDFAQPSSDASATARLHAFFVTEWDWMMGQNPTWASVLGDRRWNDRWEDLTPAAFAARERHQRDALNRLAAIPRAELEPEDQVSYDVFRYLYETQVEGYQYRWHYIRTNTYDGVQTVQRLADSLTFASEQDYRDWIARLRAFPEYMAQNIALMRLGIQENILLPKVIMRRIAAQAQRLATEPPEQSGFLSRSRPWRPAFRPMCVKRCELKDWTLSRSTSNRRTGR